MTSRASYLLAVDIGLHTGLAMYDDTPQLLWYRSHHLSGPLKLKKMIDKLLRDPPQPTHIYLEGGGPLAEIWQREAERRFIAIRLIHAETWRERLCYPRQHLNGSRAKKEADGLARRAIDRLGGRKPTQLRHDTAEAILIGLFGLLELGWLDSWPDKGRTL